MAASRVRTAVDNAGFSIDSSGFITEDLTNAGLERLRRIVHANDGELSYEAVVRTASLTKFAGTAGKEIEFTAVSAGTGGNSLAVVFDVPADDNQAHPIAVSDDGSTLTVTLGVDTDGSTIVSTIADVVAAIESDANGFLTAALGSGAGSDESLGRITFEDIGQSGDDLILTGKTAHQAFGCFIRPPRNHEDQDNIVVNYDSAAKSALITVPSGKTIANIKTAIEANAGFNAIVTVTTAGTTSHAYDGAKHNASASFANRGSALATTFTSAALAGGVDAANSKLKVSPADA